MRDHYDFSNAERGKFYRPRESLRIPVYLDPDVRTGLLAAMGNERGDFQAYVNELLRRDMEALKHKR